MIYESESNNSFSSANYIPNGEQVFGQLSSYADIDYFKFTASLPGIITARVAPPVNNENLTSYSYYIYDPSGLLLGSGQSSIGWKGVDTAQAITTFAGDYYIKITTNYVAPSGIYTLTVAVPADTTPPEVLSFSPLDEAIGVTVASNININFSEAVAKGAGGIVLKTTSGVTVATYDTASSSNLSISGSTLTINPTDDLAYNTSYRVEFVAGAIKDLTGNSYAGTTSYNFTTLQTFTGTSANESFRSGTGNDAVDGGAGVDSVIYSGSRSNYTLTKGVSTYTVTDKTGVDGTDSLTNIERLQFSDRTVALDINGIAGQAYRLYQAAFNRKPDNGGLKYWIGLMDGGYTLPGVASEFIASPEFKALYGSNPTNELFVSKLYDNVLHRVPDTGGYNYWLGLLNTNNIDNISTLIYFSESTENQAGLIGVIQNGIDLLND